jgi:hypothetical protein
MKTRFYRRLLIDNRLKKLNIATLNKIIINISDNIFVNLLTFAIISKFKSKLINKK